MFGIIVCKGCNRKRIIDLSVETSKCPYCNEKSDVSKANVIFKNEDQSVVRGMFDSLSGVVVEKKSIDKNIDPISSLIYEVEHISNTYVKMETIAKGLTKIKGTFTEDDVEDIVPGQGAKFIKAMLDECIIHEVEYGKYKV